MVISIKEFVQQTISERRLNRQQKHIGPDHAVWNAFSPQHYTLLKDLIQSPLTFAPDAYPDVLQQVDSATQNDEQPTAYIRTCTADVETMVASIQKYCQMYPADEKWCALVLEHVALLPPSNLISLHYGGMSFSSTPFERSQQDNQSAGGSRMLNWLKANNELAWDVYQLQDLSFDPSFSLVEYGFIEDFIIKAIGDIALNSANGGYYVDYQPSTAICQFWRNISTSVEFAHYLQQAPTSVYTDDALRKHFNDYGKFMQRMAMQGMTAMVAPTEQLIQALIAQAQPKTTINDTTVSVIVGEDIPTRSLKSKVFGYLENDIISSSACFFRETLDFLSSLSGITSIDLLFPPFVDLYAMHSKQPLLPSILFLSRYMTIVQPVVIVSMSKIVFTHFHLDTFCTTWLNTASTTAFLQHYRSPNVYGDLPDIAKMEPAPCTAFFKASTTHLTDVAIVAYGPGDTDYALLFPIRNPGSLKYDSATQALKAEEITLSICAMNVLDSLVRRRLANGEERPTDKQQLTVGSSLYSWNLMM
ncbi:hypothetical protein LRAMOSA03515 [Lichtheimia ramosa]|uniref:Uncharacterized protein n=1 Tax=Lichtheimia ramosa TaxID=688394 RepID=A0A077WWR1_9FUNG|nr:hypothetical protein LRAMOSA03515 [Lichtheimia ramosa]